MVQKVNAPSTHTTQQQKNTKQNKMGMEAALENIWTVVKVIMACSPVLVIAAILIFAREDEETEVAKRKIKCARG